MYKGRHVCLRYSVGRKLMKETDRQDSVGTRTVCSTAGQSVSRRSYDRPTAYNSALEGPLALPVLTHKTYQVKHK